MHYIWVFTYCVDVDCLVATRHRRIFVLYLCWATEPSRRPTHRWSLFKLLCINKRSLSFGDWEGPMQWNVMPQLLQQQRTKIQITARIPMYSHGFKGQEAERISSATCEVLLLNLLFRFHHIPSGVATADQPSLSPTFGFWQRFFPDTTLYFFLDWGPMIYESYLLNFTIHTHCVCANRNHAIVFSLGRHPKTYFLFYLAVFVTLVII